MGPFSRICGVVARTSHTIALVCVRPARSAPLSTAAKKRPSSFVWASLRQTDLFRDAVKAHEQSASSIRKRKDPTERRKASLPRLTDEMRSALDPSAPVVSAQRSSLFTHDDDRRIVAMLKEGAGWTEIANALGKKRRQIEARFVDVLDPRLRHGPFTAEEDAAIRAHVDAHGPTSWPLLSKSMGHARSDMRLHARWELALANASPWTEDERRRLLEGVKAHGRDWDAVARHVGGGRTGRDCDCLFGGAMRTTMGPRKEYAFFTPEEDARLCAAVEKNGRTWGALSKEFGGRSVYTILRRYDRRLLPQWLRVPIRNEIASLVRILRADGAVDGPLSSFKDAEGARNWVALCLGMDGASQVDWDALNRASGAERGAAMDAVRELERRLSAEEWKKGATRVWVPSWSWPRPICEVRASPIGAVAKHPAIRPFVRVVGCAVRGD